MGDMVGGITAVRLILILFWLIVAIKMIQTATIIPSRGLNTHKHSINSSFTSLPFLLRLSDVCRIDTAVAICIVRSFINDMFIIHDRSLIQRSMHIVHSLQRRHMACSLSQEVSGMVTVDDRSSLFLPSFMLLPWECYVLFAFIVRCFSTTEIGCSLFV